MLPSTLSNITRCALHRMGIAMAMARLTSVLAFQWITTVWPSDFGGDGGAINTGRPLSKSADSSASGPRPVKYCQIVDAGEASQRRVSN